MKFAFEHVCNLYKMWIQNPFQIYNEALCDTR